jgi:hypothetical protein
MKLTVIVPDERPGMQRMLERELQDIDGEVIYDSWRSGLEKARGDFVCFLEFDSAVQPGSIRRLLNVFARNSHYRKLAMVSPMVEFDDMPNPLAMRVGGGLGLAGSTEPHACRVGCTPGAVVRKSSIKKFPPDNEFGAQVISEKTSIDFWENGLRVMVDPQSVYYTPQQFSDEVEPIAPSEALMSLWNRECISD